MFKYNPTLSGTKSGSRFFTGPWEHWQQVRKRASSLQFPFILVHLSKILCRKSLPPQNPTHKQDGVVDRANQDAFACLDDFNFGPLDFPRDGFQKIQVLCLDNDRRHSKHPFPGEAFTRVDPADRQRRFNLNRPRLLLANSDGRNFPSAIPLLLGLQLKSWSPLCCCAIEVSRRRRCHLLFVALPSLFIRSLMAAASLSHPVRKHSTRWHSRKSRSWAAFGPKSFTAIFSAPT